MNLKSAFTKGDFKMAYLAVFTALGVTNFGEVDRLAELTHEAADVIGAARAMREAMGVLGTLEVYPGAVHRALDYLRPRHEEWQRLRARVIAVKE